MRIPFFWYAKYHFGPLKDIDIEIYIDLALSLRFKISFQSGIYIDFYINMATNYINNFDIQLCKWSQVNRDKWAQFGDIFNRTTQPALFGFCSVGVAMEYNLWDIIVVIIFPVYISHSNGAYVIYLVFFRPM